MRKKHLVKKTVVFLLIGLFALVAPLTVFSHSGEQGNVKVDDVVQEILQKQNVSGVKDLDCSKISNDEFEKLGEAVMSYMHPNEKEHTAMDDMMGGEGSESLRQAHITMGKRFLGCEGVPGFMGMMEPGMMSSGMMGFDEQNGYGREKFNSERGWMPMMGFGMGPGMGVFGFLGLLTWLALIVFLVLGSIYFYKKLKSKS